MGGGRSSLAGDWPLTGGLLNITAAAWTAGFHWWRSGNITRTQNVSEFMVVLALCLINQLVARYVHVSVMKCLCDDMKVFVPMLVLGYTLFAAALFIRLWMLLLALRWEKVMHTE